MLIVEGSPIVGDRNLPQRSAMNIDLRRRTDEVLSRLTQLRDSL
jgi:hypothetical protein